jgi:two-component system OmpR family sensor kinase
LDAQLVRFASGVERAPPAGPVEIDAQAPNTGFQFPLRVGSGRDSNFSTLYVGVFEGGALTTSVRPARGDSSRAIPKVTRADARELAADEGFTSVGSTRDGTRYRVTARRTASGDLTVLAVQLNDVDAAVSRLITVAIVAGFLIVVVLGLITWWVLRLGVRPVERMTAAASAVAAGDLDGRIPDAPERTEAAALGTALNAMLQRMRDLLDERAVSEQRLRRFLADASHELRTPVTTIRGYAELYRSGGLEDRAQRDAALARTEAEAIRLGRLVQDMTTLARLDERISRSPGDVALDELAEAAIADFQVTHPDRSVTIAMAPVVVRGDTDQLHQVLANLLDNVAAHTPQATPVEIDLSADGPWARLRVIDHGPGVPEEVAARAFERFYRADPSRSRASGGSGLGLSIVAAIVDAHGGFVEMHGRSADDPQGRGTTITVELPVLRVSQPVQG